MKNKKRRCTLLTVLAVSVAALIACAAALSMAGASSSSYVVSAGENLGGG